MDRSARKTIAWLCLTALLFLQAAVSAYACPAQGFGTSTSPAIVHAGQPCQGMDQERPKLCEQHAAYASQAADTQPHSTVSAPVLPLIAILVQPDLHASIKHGVQDA